MTYEDEEGCARVVYFDMNYNTALALLRPDFDEDAYQVRGAEFENKKLELRILSPVDLAVSKISRFEDNDREDIAELARHGLVQGTALQERTMQTLDFYIGDQTIPLVNLKQAVQIVLEARLDRGRNGSRTDPGHGR